MTDPLATQAALELVDRSDLLMLTTMDDKGYPETRVMFAMGHEALETFWFSTHTSSRKVAQIQADPRACVCVVDMDGFHGLSLVGRIEVLEDAATKERLWREGFERFFPLGAADPDYAVLRFVVEEGRYSHGQRVVTLDL